MRVHQDLPQLGIEDDGERAGVGARIGGVGAAEVRTHDLGVTDEAPVFWQGLTESDREPEASHTAASRVDPTPQVCIAGMYSTVTLRVPTNPTFDCLLNTAPGSTPYCGSVGHVGSARRRFMGRASGPADYCCGGYQQ